MPHEATFLSMIVDEEQGTGANKAQDAITPLFTC
jgi:hypothetical protein